MKICAKDCHEHHHDISEYDVFPGIEAEWRDHDEESLHMEHDASDHTLEINHCHMGRCGWKLNDGTSIYMGEGDVTLHSTVLCSDSVMEFPLNMYHGITITIDLDALKENPPAALAGNFINWDAIIEKYCRKDASVQMQANTELEHIFAPLYHLPSEMELPYLQLKCQELLLYLCRQNSSDLHDTRVSSTQTETVQQVHDLITAHPEQRFTIDELSARFLINTTTLKDVFKTVYGMPIATYMKDYRMQHAGKLLLHTEDSIAEIARAVGYESQSKFSTAFKESTGMLPRDYRKNAAHD